MVARMMPPPKMSTYICECIRLKDKGELKVRVELQL